MNCDELENLSTLNQIDGIPSRCFTTKNGLCWVYESYVFGIKKTEDFKSPEEARKQISRHLFLAINGWYLSVKARKLPGCTPNYDAEPLIVWRQHPEFSIDYKDGEKIWKISTRLLIVPPKHAEYVRNQLESKNAKPIIAGIKE